MNLLVISCRNSFQTLTPRKKNERNRLWKLLFVALKHSQGSMLVFSPQHSACNSTVLVPLRRQVNFFILS